MQSPLIECPHCNSPRGFYIKSYAQASFHQTYSFDGSLKSGAVEQIIENMSIRMGKWAYCENCNRPLHEWFEHQPKN